MWPITEENEDSHYLSATKNKRLRSTNFSDFERNVLIELTNKFKHILENKRTDHISNRNKNECWRKITPQFNALSDQERDVKCLRSKYESLKKEFRRKKKLLCKRNEWAPPPPPPPPDDDEHSHLLKLDDSGPVLIKEEVFEDMPLSCEGAEEPIVIPSYDNNISPLSSTVEGLQELMLREKIEYNRRKHKLEVENLELDKEIKLLIIKKTIAEIELVNSKIKPHDE